MPTSPTLVLRADADHKSGTGRVMRCLALGLEWQRRGGKVIFLTHSPPLLHQRLSNSGFEISDFETPPSREEDLARCESVLRFHPGSAFVLDGYSFDEEFHASLRKHARVTLVIDDLANLPYYDCDFVLNQSPAAENLTYPHSPSCHLLLGARYALLRESVREIARRGKKVSPSVERLVISMGGSDPLGFTLRCLQAIEPVTKSLEVDVIVGPANKDLAKLQAFAQNGSSRVTLHTHVPEVAEIFYEADLALIAGGITSLELAAIGTPFVTLQIAENQSGNLNEMVARKVTASVGRGVEFSATGLTGQLNAVLSDYTLRQEFSRNGRAMVDGRAFERLLPLLLT